MCISTRTFLICIALTGLSAQVYAQASDVDCVRCVDASDIAPDAVSINKIRNKAVTTSKLAPRAVTTGKIRDGAITENKLSANLSNAMLGTRLPRVLDGGDNLIGYLVNIADDNQSIDVLTEQGYIRSGLAFSNGQALFPGTVWFSGGNCTGTAYTSMPNGFVRVLYDETGVEKLYYADKNSAAQVSPPILSRTGNAGCSGICCGIPLAWPVLPNDPNVTGISNQAYTVPIKIEYTQ